MTQTNAMAQTSNGTINEPEDTSDKGNASIRVHVRLLDTLMTLAGELVLSRNQLLQGVASGNVRATEVSSQRIDMITSALQETIMRTRMQPMADMLNKLNPVVMDLSQQVGKSIALVIEGNEVELDKTILESIHDPVTQLVRNCVDHGIETPGERESTGKKAMGNIRVRAFHDAGQVNILISDDGNGLDPLEITGASGQGVDMTGVVAHIESLGGILEIDSQKGVGTDITIKLPLTLAIIPSQITCVGRERYAVPQVNLDELLRIPLDQVKERIEKVGDADVVRLRGELLPLLDLSQMLGIEKRYVDLTKGTALPDRRKNIADRRSKRHSLDREAAIEMVPDSVSKMPDRASKDRRSGTRNAINIAVVSAGAYTYGLIVDQLQDSEEIVVKPMGRHLKRSTAFAGATIMGDGKVALILDIANLAQMAGLSTMPEVKQLTTASEASVHHEEPKTALLTFKNSENEYFAVPLDSVERIERIQTAAIEQIGERKVVQYRGGTLSLCQLSQAADVKPLTPKEHQEIVVFKVRDRELGLMVNPPVDTIAVCLKIDKKTFCQPAIKGSMIINDHTTLMIDVLELASVIHPEWV
ncbi:MAG: chemotaxis protein CheW [Proteobacteria bacterium]|nr:hypothetical protein [Desulfobacula sp.]MBU3951628.1 chemotaxis protein CheW [Pseudomonadota bacterium]MBU4132776.1 chemotaxis protein CheW [Pseudomonadota bacterium]